MSAGFLLSCHCQRNVIALTVPTAEGGDHGTPVDTAALFPSAMTCDCSHCSKRRVIWHFTKLEALKVLKGCNKENGDLKEYKFGSEKLNHQFCPSCGTHLLGGSSIDNPDKSASVGVNLRAIRDAKFDYWSLKPNAYPGKAHGKAYDPPQLPEGAKEYLDKRAKLYDYPTEILAGGCHCKAVTFGVLSKALKEVNLADCNCSICGGNGILWCYPGRYDVFFHPSPTSTPYQPDPALVTRYRFAGSTRNHDHVICNSCGCEIFQAVEPTPEFLSEQEQKGQPWEGKKAKGEKFFMGVNASLFNGIEEFLKSDEEEMKKGLGGYQRGYGRTKWGKEYKVEV